VIPNLVKSDDVRSGTKSNICHGWLITAGTGVNESLRYIHIPIIGNTIWKLELKLKDTMLKQINVATEIDCKTDQQRW